MAIEKKSKPKEAIVDILTLLRGQSRITRDAYVKADFGVVSEAKTGNKDERLPFLWILRDMLSSSLTKTMVEVEDIVTVLLRKARKYASCEVKQVPLQHYDFLLDIWKAGTDSAFQSLSRSLVNYKAENIVISQKDKQQNFPKSNAIVSILTATVEAAKKDPKFGLQLLTRGRSIADFFTGRPRLSGFLSGDQLCAMLNSWKENNSNVETYSMAKQRIFAPKFWQEDMRKKFTCKNWAQMLQNGICTQADVMKYSSAVESIAEGFIRVFNGSQSRLEKQASRLREAFGVQSLQQLSMCADLLKKHENYAWLEKSFQQLKGIHQQTSVQLITGILDTPMNPNRIFVPVASESLTPRSPSPNSSILNYSTDLSHCDSDPDDPTFSETESVLEDESVSDLSKCSDDPDAPCQLENGENGGGSVYDLSRCGVDPDSEESDDDALSEAEVLQQSNLSLPPRRDPDAPDDFDEEGLGSVCSVVLSSS